MRIDESVLPVLESSSIQNGVLLLPPGQLPRKQYEAVNKCLEALGGKWNKKARGHVFECDPSELLEVALRTGTIVDAKREFQFFPTPLEIVSRMMDLAGLVGSDRALEPSAGRGAIAREVRKVCPVTVIELNRQNAAALRADGFDPIEMDFLQYSDGNHNKIVMNPPFSRQQDIDHILHAFDVLTVGGVLVSVVSESPFFRNSQKSATFREFLEDCSADVIHLPVGAFAESGTDVKARIITVQK